MRRTLLLIAASVALIHAQGVRPGDVLNSSHNLTPSGSGPLKSGDSRPCVFCHISHQGYTAPGYLWNQKTSQAAYTPYQSPTLTALAGNPGVGSSKLCLSCHDGTVAVGQTVAGGTLVVSGSIASADLLGTDFSRHHPVGIRPSDDGQLFVGLAATPATASDPSVRLPNNRIECVSCHDPHTENRDGTRRRFLVRTNDSSALCLACHDVNRPAPSQINGWLGSAHQIATNTVAEYYGRVNANGCLSCHLPHNPTANKPLLRGAEETACYACHGGSLTSPVLLPLNTVTAKPYAHPANALAGAHQPGENAYPLNGTRHAECPDCHNGHAAQAGVGGTAPTAQRALTGATGVDGTTGASARRPAANEYEVCLKCHGNSSGKPQALAGYALYGRTVWRISTPTSGDPFNKRLEFSSLAGRHNVINPRRLGTAEVPSLRGQMLTLTGAGGTSLSPGSYLYCSDCHSSDQGRASGGAEAAGPHGSNWPHLLERRYELEPPPPVAGGSGSGVIFSDGLNGTAALCYKCHDTTNSILQNSSFREHRTHIVEQRTGCGTCHASHGVAGGTATNNYALIDFDSAIVRASSSGALRFERTGAFHGRCYLTCHNVNHNPYSY